MATRLPIHVSREVRQIAEDQDWSYSDTLAALIVIALRHREELPTAEQEELPLTKAS